MFGHSIVLIPVGDILESQWSIHFVAPVNCNPCVVACVRVLICCECVCCMRVFGLRKDPEHLGVLPWVV